jgi:glycosyltransferase involved in cell wall biosynthesis
MTPPVLHMLPDLALGGGQIMLLRTVSALRERGGEHLVCALRGGPCEADFRNAGIPILVASLDGKHRAAGAFRRALKFAAQAKVGIVHTNSTPSDRAFGQMLALKLGVPVVNTFHGMPPGRIGFPHRLREAPAFLKQKAMLSANRLLSRINLTHSVAVSAPVAEAYIAWLGLPPESMTVIHNGLPASAYASPDPAKSAALRAELNLDGRSPVLIAVARLVEGKGHALLLDTLAQLVPHHPDALLLLAGDGPLRPALEHNAAERGLERHIRFLGTRSDVTALLAVSDILLSASAFEGFGLAVLEGMAQGLPVVALDLPALRAFIDNGSTGILVPYPQPAALAAAIRKLLADPDVAAELGQNARRRAEAFSIEASAAGYEALYRDLINQAAPVPKPTVSAPARMNKAPKP